MQEQKHTFILSIFVSVLSFIMYAIVFLILAPQMGKVISILVTIPVVISTWRHGLRFGILAWLAAMLLNVSLDAMLGFSWQISSSIGMSILFVTVLAVGYARNVSMRLKQELNKRYVAENELQALYNATSRLFHADNMIELGEQIVEAVAEEFNQMDCGLLLSVSGSIVRLARSGVYQASPDQVLQREGKGLIPEALRTGNIVYAPDVYANPHYLPNVASTRSELVIPLKTAKGTIGVLDLQSPKLNDFNQHTQRVLVAYAERAAAAIETQLLNDELQRHVSELEWRVLQRTVDVQKAKEQIEAILNNSIDTIMLVSPEGIIQQVNPAFTQISYQEPEIAIGQSLFMLFDDINTKNLQIGIDQLERDNQVICVDMQIQRMNGTLMDVDIMLSSIRNEDGEITGIVCNIHDITERKQSLEAIRHSQAQLQGIMDNTQAIIYIKDLEGRYLLVNRQFEKVFDISREKIRGKTDSDLFTAAECDIFGEHDRRVLREATPLVFEESISRDEQVYTYISNKFPIIDVNGNVYGVCGISTDITTQKQIEESLRTALIREQELHALKSQFISTVSHEFRTPLAVIGSSTDILLAYHERLTDEKREQKLHNIQAQIGRLTHLMREVLIVGKADMTGLSFEPKATDVLDLCQTIIEEVSIAYKNEDVAIDFVHQGIEETDLMIDEHLFQHIFQNLLSNAIKYSKPQTTVSVQILCHNSSLRLVLRDEGIGIPEEYRKDLFKSFHRASNVSTIPGTGLGLAIVKHAVDGHNGTITYESVEGEGTTFEVVLPTERIREVLELV